MTQRHAEVIVIGAGAIGMACAYFLTLRGIKPLVLERRHLAAGSSGAAAALITVDGAGPTDDPLDRLTFESHGLIRDIQNDFDRPIEMVQQGSLGAVVDEAEYLKLSRYFNGREASEDGFRFMDGDEARNFEPLLGPDILGALFNPQDYHINPFRLCEGYLNAALRRGGEIAYGIDVRQVETADRQVKRVVTGEGDYSADWVVVAGGAHTADILKSIGIEIPITPARGQVIITEACEAMTGRILFFPGHLYIKQSVSGNFYLGSHTEFVGFDSSLTLDKLTTYAQELGRAVPLLSKLKAIRFFTGFRPLSADERPIIGPLPSCPRLIVAAGHGRNGICYSAATGKAVSEMIVDGTTGLPMGAFRPNRFSDE